MSCSVTDWRMGAPDYVLSLDNTVIYSFFTYGHYPEYYLYFVAFSSFNGGIISTRYKSASNFGNVRNSVLVGDYVVTL